MHGYDHRPNFVIYKFIERFCREIGLVFPVYVFTNCLVLSAIISVTAFSKSHLHHQDKEYKPVLEMVPPSLNLVLLDFLFNLHLCPDLLRLIRGTFP